jgi:hypothetical protein
MNARLGPILLAVVLVALAFVIFRGRSGEGLFGRRSQGGAERGAPEETVFAMVRAARDGDTAAYLDCFWGPLRSRLEQTGCEMGQRRFADYLTRTAAAITGVVYHAEPEPVGADVKVHMEMVYRDKNELQDFVLTRRRGRWRILEMTGPQRIETIIPYGSEAYPLLPPARGEEEEQSQ